MHHLYFYSSFPLPTLEAKIEAFQEEFEAQLRDNFQDDELAAFETMLDEMGAVSVQPLLEELTFDDLTADPYSEVPQRSFFDLCRSSVVFERLPYLEANPFQVSYLRDLLGLFDEVLVDRGGAVPVLFKEGYLEILGRYKNLDQLITVTAPKAALPKPSTVPVEPIDFLIRDVYNEIRRLQGRPVSLEGASEKVRKIFGIMSLTKEDATGLLRLSGMGAKDFDDHLERLKFFLKKVD